MGSLEAGEPVGGLQLLQEVVAALETVGGEQEKRALWTTATGKEEMVGRGNRYSSIAKQIHLLLDSAPIKGTGTNFL